MASTKSPRDKDKRSKKRKRDTNESDEKSKKHRQRDSNSEVNGTDALRDRLLGDADTQNGVISINQPSINSQKMVSHHDSGDAGWRISNPMGGRMLDIDPILTENERHLIVAYNTSIQIYNAADSLLVRRIPISARHTPNPRKSAAPRIVAMRASRSNPEFVWVACSDGQVFHVDWSQNQHPDPAFKTASGTAKALAVVPVSFAESREVLIIAESENSGRVKVIAYQPDNGSAQSVVDFEKQGHGLPLLESSDEGSMLVGAFQDQLFVGTLTSAPQKLEDVKYSIFTFDTPDIITCIDLRLRAKASHLNGARRGTESALDLAVGGARGSIYTYHDAVSAMRSLGASSATPRNAKNGLAVRKYHWHSKAVHAVKWSRDGEYIISGGSENVLVQWQIDTARKDYLPHLSASIENIVVSSTGSSYVLHLDDNSAMILSTAELKPTAYIAGIQSAAIDVCEPKDLLVRRVWNVAEDVRRPIPAAIRPSEPSTLHVCVGNGRQATMSGELSAPMLQSFDLQSFTSIGRQALARTQTTDRNMTKKGHTIDEPAVTHIAFSGDGRWLVSVDDWQPDPRDLENVSADLKDQFLRERREIHLKFWEVRSGLESIALVSRINAPHATKWPEPVLDLASDPTSSAFATVGADGAVRLWRPRIRQQDGLIMKDAHGNDAFAWTCALVVPVGDGTGGGSGTDVMDLGRPVELHGKICFSEDGSTLFVGFGAADSGMVHIVDVASGQIVKTLDGLWNGQLQSIRALSSYIIVLSKSLNVFDVVGDELRYGFAMSKFAGVPELLQLAVDSVSGHFAVTLPAAGMSCVGVFDPAQPTPLLVKHTPRRVVSLVSTPDNSGFIALDDAAQILVIAQGSEPRALSTAQPLEDLRLNPEPEAPNAPSTDAADAMDVASEDGHDDEDVHMEDDDDDDDADDTNVRVVSQQSLTDIFDAAPAFAAPSIEDMFYKVTGLLATKPLAGS